METPDLEGFWRLGLSLASLNMGDYVSDYQTYYLKPQTRKTYAKSFTRKGLMALYSVNDLLLSATNDEVTDISAATSGDGNIVATAIGNDNTFWVTQLENSDNGYLLTVKQISSSGEVLNTFADDPVPTRMSDITVMPGGRVFEAVYNESGMIQIIDLSKGDEGAFVENWPLIDAATNQPLGVWEDCKLYLMPSGGGNVEVFAWIKTQNNDNPLLQSGSLYHARANFPVSNDDPVVPSIPQIVFSAFPNPMREELKLSVETSLPVQTVIDIYNLKGQKVRSLAGNAQALSHQYLWNGCDDNDRKVSSGIYLLKLKVDGKVMQTKRICRY